MSASDLVKAAVRARRTAKVKGRAALDALSGVGAMRAAVKEAETVGVAAADASKLGDRAADVERRARLLDDVEKEMKRVAAKGGQTAVGAVKAAGAAPRGGALSRLWASMSAKDRAFMLDEAIRLVRSGKDVHNNMVGAVREVAVKYLPDVRREIIEAVTTMRGKTARNRGLSTLDTGVRGPVHLPTKKAMAGGRSIELGTDRLIGSVRALPEKVPVTWADGKPGNVWVAGELEVALAIEVKGKTNARAGITQLEALVNRGGHGYVVIDGQFWLLKYDASTVKHVVIAPAGEQLNAARRALASGKSVSKSAVVEIPKDFDGRCHGMADHFLDLARKYVEGAP